jgi:hypothetical protein
MKQLILMYVSGKVKGIFTKRDLDNYCGRVWWDKTRYVNVPLRDYEVGRITASNVQNYILHNKHK